MTNGEVRVKCMHVGCVQFLLDGRENKPQFASNSPEFTKNVHIDKIFGLYFRFVRDAPEFTHR